MDNNNYGTQKADTPAYEEGGAGLGQQDGQAKSGMDPQRENQDAGSLRDGTPESTGETGGYGGTSDSSGASTETEGGKDMQRGGSWRPAGEPSEGAYQAENSGDEGNADLSADSARFDSSDSAVSADDLIEPGQSARGL